MRGKALFAAGLAAAAVVATAGGCHHDKYGLAFKPKEEVVLPSDEPRFNNPPSAPYKKKAVQSDDEKTLINRNKYSNASGPLGQGF